MTISHCLVQGSLLLVVSAGNGTLKISWMQVKLSSAVQEGRGLVAGQAIRKGEALLHVPQHLLLTPEAALRCSSMADLLDHAALPAWSVLAALLAELKIGQTGTKGTWSPYIDALPLQNGCVLEWSADEVSMQISRQCALPSRLSGSLVDSRDSMKCIAMHDNLKYRQQRSTDA